MQNCRSLTTGQIISTNQGNLNLPPKKYNLLKQKQKMTEVLEKAEKLRQEEILFAFYWKYNYDPDISFQIRRNSKKKFLWNLKWKSNEILPWMHNLYILYLYLYLILWAEAVGIVIR